jgi:septal ring factor EnvC (AmiA/AmiB activator)
MSRYRATDEQLDREIDTLERIGRVRLRRAAAELNEVDKDLRELRKEKARRAARAAEMTSSETPVSAESPTSES